MQPARNGAMLIVATHLSRHCALAKPLDGCLKVKIKKGENRWILQ
jgi:hypothetical protein